MPDNHELIERLRRSTVQVVNGYSGGSGVVWDANGTIVTNAHVARVEKPHVIDMSGRRFPARVIKHDRERDLAVLETGVRDLHPAQIGDSAALKPGHLVLAVGNPFGVAGAVSIGVVHAVGPVYFGPRGDWVQADVRLAPGNSGGMLADTQGRVVGINTMIADGLGLAIPSNEAQEFATGQPDGVRLGVEMIGVREGLVVVGVERGSLAERAQVIVGDVLRCTPDQLRRMLADVTLAGSADIPVLRGGRVRTLRIHTRAEAKAA
jgi:serine protease Do